MKATIKFKYGKTIYEFEIDEKDEMETLHKSIVLGNPPDKCDNCQNTEGLYFTTNKDKEGNTYINAKCPKCDARAKLGQYKAGGYFWHRFELYKPEQAVTASTPPRVEPPAEPKNTQEEIKLEDIPF